MYSARMSNLPPYLFARIDEMKAEQQKKGVDIIDLGVGDPDLPTPSHIVDALCTAARDPNNHHYPSYAGMPAYREAVAGWYHKRFGVTLDASKETLALMGSKDGITHIGEAFVNPGDYVLAPSPGYPGYSTGTLFSEGKVHEMPLLRENNFLPVLDDIPDKVIRSAKLMFINYPNNPTAAIAPLSFYKEVVDFAADHNIVVVSDNPYSEVAFDGYKAPSFLEGKRGYGGRDRDALALEDLQHDRAGGSGWRSVMRDILPALAGSRPMSIPGSLTPSSTQAIAALSGPQDCVKEACAIYQERRDVLVSGLPRARL